VKKGTVFHYSTHAVVLNYHMEAGSGRINQKISKHC